MTWYYADGSRQVGPIEEAALDDLVRTGVVRDDTLVWRDGMANWQPHSQVRGARPALPPPAAAASIAADTGYCSECGRPFAMSQLVAIGAASVCAQCKPVYLQRMREGGQAIGARKFGGFWIRFVARVIDSVILAIALMVVNIPIEMMLGIGRINDPAAIVAAVGFLGIVWLIDAAASCAYEVYFLSTRGATPGKMVLGLKVVRSDGSMLTTGQAVGRYFAYLLSGFTLLIGFIIAGFDDQKRALHDRICDTRVIYAK
jgi:uncharacterized RDD family membrane protein YckC